jgi:phosphocarrier protein HPr
MPLAEKSVPIVNSAGLHARPAAQLVKLSNQFKCEIHVGKDDLHVNAKSIMGVLMLAAEKGSFIHIRCEGDDAGAALAAIEALVARGFEED